MRKLVNFCDFFVLCTGNSDRHVLAVAGGIEDDLNKININIAHKEGMHIPSDLKEAPFRWVVLDVGDVVVHIFEQEARTFYGLEHLWSEAKNIKW